MTTPTQPTDHQRTPDLLWRRVGGAITDVAILAVIAIVVGVVFRDAIGVALAILAAYQLVALVWWQGRTGASPGKRLVGLRVVDAEGRPCGPVKALTRWLAWVIDGFPYCLPVVGFAMIFTNADERRVGDRVAGTWVVPAERLGFPPLPGAALRALTAGPDPVWDDPTGRYLRTDPASGRREAFDETAMAWVPLDPDQG